MKDYRNDPEYKALRSAWSQARLLITPLIQQQALIRLLLKSETDPEMIRQLRADLMKNRKGPNGLRSLNKRIRAFYSYCEKRGGLYYYL